MAPAKSAAALPQQLAPEEEEEEEEEEFDNGNVLQRNRRRRRQWQRTKVTEMEKRVTINIKDSSHSIYSIIWCC